MTRHDDRAAYAYSSTQPNPHTVGHVPLPERLARRGTATPSSAGPASLGVVAWLAPRLSNGSGAWLSAARPRL
jgi:hypothetical protein